MGESPKGVVRVNGLAFRVEGFGLLSACHHCPYLPEMASRIFSSTTAALTQAFALGRVPKASDSAAQSYKLQTNTSAPLIPGKLKTAPASLGSKS